MVEVSLLAVSIVGLAVMVASFGVGFLVGVNNGKAAEMAAKATLDSLQKEYDEFKGQVQDKLNKAQAAGQAIQEQFKKQ